MSRFHVMAASVATLLVATFFASTALVETFGAAAQVAAVKTAIAWGLLLLVPAMAGAGASGFALSRGREGPVIARKRARMRLVGALGLCVLAPAALFLAYKARAGAFDAWFAYAQAIELAAGATNLVLLILNFRDGLRLTRGRRLRQAARDHDALARENPP